MYIKRPFDLTLSAFILLIGLPVYATLAILIYVKLGSPILFRQQRPGLHNKPFTIYKFSAMTDVRDEAGNLLPDAQRLPPFGRLSHRV